MRMVGKIACIVLGLLGLILIVLFDLYRPRVEVLRSPISLDAKQTTSAKFNVDETYDYYIKILFHRVPDKRTLCLFAQGSGYPFYPEHCSSKPVVQVSWKLVGDGVLVARGNGSEYADGIELQDKDTVAARIVGRVHLRRGVQYCVVMSPQEEMSSLKKFDPTLVVEAQVTLGMRGAFLVPLVFLFSIILICGGTVALFIENSERRKRIRRQAQIVP